jgi:hypothetical protein
MTKKAELQGHEPLYELLICAVCSRSISSHGTGALVTQCDEEALNRPRWASRCANSEIGSGTLNMRSVQLL